MKYRLFPRSLAGQLTFLLIAALLLAQSMTTLIFTEGRRSAIDAAAREQVLGRMAALVRLIEETPDVQRDHIRLIDGTMRLLAPGGTLFFSNNRRGFVLDETLPERYAVRDISRQSVPEDFRNKKIHQCWQIGHRV